MTTKFIFLPLALLLLIAFNSYSTTQNIDILNYSFSNQDITINVGDKITWTNNSGTTHTVTEGTNCTSNGGFNSPNIAGNGGTFEKTFTSAGTVNYFCSIHCTMTGKITVVDNTTDVLSSTVVIADLKTFPNPFVTTSEVQVNLLKPGKVKVEIYDMYGHKLMELPEEEKEAGTQSFPITGESLRDGIFICKVYFNGKPAASEYLVKKSKS